MSFSELQMAYEKIMRAVFPEDIFSPSEYNQLLQIKKEYRLLSKAVHPDSENGRESKKLAEEAFLRLNDFYKKALDKINVGTYGNIVKENQEDTNYFLIKTKKREYNITSTLAQGDLSNIYEGNCIESDDEIGKIVVKIVNDPMNNDLVQNEIRVLKLFQEHPSNQSKHLPMILDQFKTVDGQVGIIMRYFDGYDLHSVREKYTEGIPQKHVVWIMNRLLSALGRVHQMGIIHTNIDPSHIMIRPRDHNLMLLDWSYSTIDPIMIGRRFRVLNEDYSPPEVIEQKPPIPASDLYSVGKCMIYLLDGDLKTNRMSSDIDDRLQRFFQFFVRDSPLQRAQDAWEMHAQLVELIKEMWGSIQFLEFRM